MAKIIHRFPVVDGKTNEEKISQLSDALFQLIRELNLGDAEVKSTESTEVAVSNEPNNVPNNSAEIGSVKTSIEDINNKVSDMDKELDDTSKLANQLKTALDLITGRPYITESGVTSAADGTKWNYTKWSNGELEYWRIINYKHSTTFPSMSYCVGNDKYYPTTHSFKEIPALAVSAYALDGGVKLNVSLQGMSSALATIQTPVISVSTSDGSQISGVIITIYARGRTA